MEKIYYIAEIPTQYHGHFDTEENAVRRLQAAEMAVGMDGTVTAHCISGTSHTRITIYPSVGDCWSG